MKKLSKTLLMSPAVSLVLPAALFVSFNSAYASLVDTSQNQTFESRPQAAAVSKRPVSSPFIKLAAVHFIANDGNLSFGNQEFLPEDICKQGGYTHKGCPAGYVKGEACPEDGSYVKDCIDPDTWCKNNGYEVTGCQVPQYPQGACPYGSGYYKSCETDNIRACKELGYSLTCEAGKVGDTNQSCPYNESYKKCVCNPCGGYDYTASEANAQGYTPGEVCNSCGTMKYKRSANACDGFKECTDGGAAGAEVCYSGSLKKFSECKEVCDSKFQYDSSNCTGDKVLTGNSCGGKYEKCEAKVKAGDILYSDMTTSSELKENKKPIAVVFDTANKLAVAVSGNLTCFFCHRVSSGLAEYESYNPPLAAYTTEAAALADMSGAENTTALETYMKSKNETVTDGTYYMHKPSFAGLYGLPDSVWFTPALGELKNLYANRDAVDAGLRKLGSSFDGLTRRKYSYAVGSVARVVWSSTFKGQEKAWAYNFDTGAVIQERIYYDANSLRVINYDGGQICNDQYIWDASNCLSGLGGDVCGGKYETCKTAKTLPLLYSDKTVSSAYLPDKYVIGIVIDETARLAVAYTGTATNSPFEGDVFSSVPQLKKIDGLQNCKQESIDSCDADGLKNTKAVLAFGAKINQTYPAFEEVYGTAFAWGMPDHMKKANENSWFGKGKWFVPSASQLLTFYDNFERVIATSKLISPTIEHNGQKFAYSPKFEDHYMSSNQESDKTYWEVRGRRTSDDPFSINSKWPYPSVSGGTAQYAGVPVMPMIYY